MSSSRSSASKITARSGTWTSLQSGLHSDQWKAVYMGCFAQRRFVLRNNPWNNPFKPSCLPWFRHSDINDDEDARPAARHSGRIELGFMDGHSGSMRLLQLYTRQNPTNLWFTP